MVFGGLLFLIFNEREIKDMEVGGWKGGEELCERKSMIRIHCMKKF